MEASPITSCTRISLRRWGWRRKIYALRRVRPTSFQQHGNSSLRIHWTNGHLRRREGNLEYWFLIPSSPLHECLQLHYGSVLRSNTRCSGFPIHLELKYHNVHDELVMIISKLYGNQQVNINDLRTFKFIHCRWMFFQEQPSDLSNEWISFVN